MVLCQLRIQAFLLGGRRTVLMCNVCTAPSTGGLLQPAGGCAEVKSLCRCFEHWITQSWLGTRRWDGQKQSRGVCLVVQGAPGAAVYLDLPPGNAMSFIPAHALALKPSVRFPGTASCTRGLETICRLETCGTTQPRLWGSTGMTGSDDQFVFLPLLMEFCF